jgi:hypothetical protein
MDGDEAGAGNFRRGARECRKAKKVIEPMIESSCACTTIFENLRGLRKLVADRNSNLTTKRTKDTKFGKFI